MSTVDDVVATEATYAGGGYGIGVDDLAGVRRFDAPSSGPAVAGAAMRVTGTTRIETSTSTSRADSASSCVLNEGLYAVVCESIRRRFLGTRDAADGSLEHVPFDG